MCYSLAASVIAGVGLGVAGIGMTQKALRHDRQMLAFACFPLVFSVHQFTEGVVWYSVDNPFPGDEAFRYIYTIIAFLVWPILTPLAAFLAEPNEQRKRVFRAMTGVGVAVSIYLAIKLAGADGVDVRVVKHSLAYDPLFERPPAIADLAYLFLAVVPLGCTRNRAIRAFGVAVFLTFVYSILQAKAAWYSVWCLSAAVFSLCIAFGIRDPRRSAVLGEAHV